MHFIRFLKRTCHWDSHFSFKTLVQYIHVDIILTVSWFSQVTLLCAKGRPRQRCISCMRASSKYWWPIAKRWWPHWAMAVTLGRHVWWRRVHGVPSVSEPTRTVTCSRYRPQHSLGLWTDTQSLRTT